MVPGAVPAVEEVVDRALDELRVVDPAAHPRADQRGKAAVGVPAQRPHRGRPARCRLVGDGLAADALPVAEDAGTALGDVAELVLGLPDPRPDRLAALGLGHHDGVVGGAVHEVLGAVHRVDGERVVGGDVPVEHARVGRGQLLAEDEGVRVGRGELTSEDGLRLPVGDRDEVSGALLHDLAVGQGAESRRDDLRGDGLHQVQHLVGVHATTVPHAGPAGEIEPPSTAAAARSAHGQRGCRAARAPAVGSAAR